MKKLVSILVMVFAIASMMSAQQVQRRSVDSAVEVYPNTHCLRQTQKTIMRAGVRAELANDLEIVTFFPYASVPVSQAQRVPTAQARNLGTAVQTNVALSATLNGTLIGTSAPVASIEPGEISPVMTVTETLGITALGNQTLILRVAGAETNQGTSYTNTFEFVTTEHIFARDTLTAPIERGIGHYSPGGTMVSVFEITEPTFLSGVQVIFDLGSVNLMYTLRVFPMEGPMTASTTELASRTQLWSSGFVDICFLEDGVILTPGRYAVALSATSNVGISHDNRSGAWFYTMNLVTGALTVESRFGAIGLRLILDDDPPATIVARTPDIGAEDVALDANIVVDFLQDVTLISYAGITFDPPVTGVSASAIGNVLTITHDGFTAGVMYRITIPANAIGDGFQDATWTFTTEFPEPDFPDPHSLAVAVTADSARLTWGHGIILPMTEGFEGTQFSTLPAGWSPPGTATTIWRGGGTTGGVPPHTGTRQLQSLRAWAGPGWVFSRGFELTEGVTYEISFYWQAPGMNDEPDNFRVRIGTGQSSDAMIATIFEQETTTPTGVTTWSRATHTFTPTASGTFHLGFERIHGANTGNRILVDDVAIVPLVTIPEPESFNVFFNRNLVASGLTNMDHVFRNLAVGEYIAGVQAVGAGPEYLVSNVMPILFTVAPPTVSTRTPAINAFNVELDAPITITFSHTTVGVVDLTNITFNPPVSGVSATLEDGNVLVITHSGFEYSTFYEVIIPAGTIAYVNEAITWTFRTIPDCSTPPAMAYYLSQNFDLAVFPPDCWIVHRENLTMGHTWVRSVNALRPGSAGHASHHEPPSNSEVVGWLITDAVEIPATGVYNLSFWTRWAFPGDNFYSGVWISTTTNDISEFFELAELTAQAPAMWREVEVSLADFSGKTVYLAFRHQGSGPGFNSPWDIDDISINLFPVEAISKFPEENAENVRIDRDIVVTFNQTITEGTYFDQISINPPLAGFAPSITGTTVLTIAHDGFANEVEYTVTIPIGAVTGLTNEIEWSFTTTTAAVIALDKVPATDAIDVPFNATFTVRFNQDITLVSYAGITFDPPVAGVYASASDDVLTITHNGFEWETLYTITIATTAITGLVAPVTWSFTTVDAPASIPYFENFANDDGPRDLPLGWTVTPGPNGWQGGGGTNAGFVEPLDRVLFMNHDQRQQGENAWAFSERIWLEEGVSYVISFYYRAPGATFATFQGFDNFRVKIGAEPNAVALTTNGTLVYELVGQIRVPDWRAVAVVYTASFTGIHHLGFQNLSAIFAFGGRVSIDALSIIVGDTDDLNNDLAVSPAYGWLTQVPISQPLSLNATVANLGVVEQTDVVLSATRNGVDLGTSTALPSLAVYTSVVMQIQEPMTPVLGPNVIVYTVTQAETDNIPENNTLERTIIGTENVFAADMLTAPNPTGVGIPGDGGTLAVVFEITETTILSGVQILFAERGQGAVNNYTVSVFEMAGSLTASLPAIASATGVRVPGEVNVVNFSTAYNVVLTPGLYAVALTMAGFADISFDSRPDGVWYNLELATGGMFRNLGGQGFGALGIRMVIDDSDIVFELTEKTPADGATDVALDTDINVSFNLLLEEGSLAGVTISPPVAGATPRIVANQLIIDHAGLEEGTLYMVTIPAGAIVGWDEAITWSFTTEFSSTDFPDPFDLAVAVDGLNATLTWNHSEAESFNIFLGGSLVTNVTEKEHVFTNLAPGDFIAGVQAVSASGLESNIIPALFTIEALQLPGQVTLTTPANNAQNISITPTLTWTAPTSGGEVVEYFVYLGETATTLVRVAELSATETSFAVALALPYNTTHYWRIVASNAQGEGEPSATWNFTTVEEDPTSLVETGRTPSLQVFPNPVTDGYFYIEADDMRQIEIIDMLGRTVIQKNVNSSRERIDIPNLREGLYVVRVTTATGRTLVRIVVQ